MIDPGKLPAFSRLHDWFGQALVEPVRGMRMFENLSSMFKSGALAAHIQAELARKAAMEDSELREERANRKLFEVKIMTSAEGFDGEQQPAGARADGQPYRCAVVNLMGTLMKSASSMDDATSTVAAREQLRAAAADDEIDAIMLRIDSPGGYLAGTEDLAAAIRAAAAAKPTCALVEDLCASAAYWAACGASKIFANNATADIGSIGVCMCFYEAMGAAGMEGLKPVVIKTGKYKGMGFPGTEITAEQRANLQASVDQSMDQFVAVVMKGRGLTEARVRELGTGEVFQAREALQQGLIDGIKSEEQALAWLGGQAAKRQLQTRNAKLETMKGAGMERALETGNLKLTTAGALPAADAPAVPGQVISLKGDAMSDPVKKAASLAELKAKLPKSTAEFRETCLEENLSLEEAAIRHANERAEAAEQLKAAGTRIGNAPVTGKPEGALGAAAGGLAGGASAKRQLLDATAQILQASGGRVARHEAWKQALKANPDARRELVVAHNLKFGRKKQAAQFAEDFEAPAADDD